MLHQTESYIRIECASAKLLTLSTIASGMELTGVDAEKFEDDIAGVLTVIHIPTGKVFTHHFTPSIVG